MAPIKDARGDRFGEVIDLLGGLSKSIEGQAGELSTLNREVGKITVAMEFFQLQSERLEKKVDGNNVRIRDVEITEARCGNGKEIKNIWRQMSRLSAFMDMIKEKSGEDTAAIDVYAQQMQHASDMALQNNGNFWKLFLKFGPWVIVLLLTASAIGGVIAAKFIGANVPDISIMATTVKAKPKQE